MLIGVATLKALNALQMTGLCNVNGVMKIHWCCSVTGLRQVNTLLMTRLQYLYEVSENVIGVLAI